MIRVTLILAVALTTARADTYFNLTSSCVVREGECDITIKDKDGKKSLTDEKYTETKTVDDLQQCADRCEVQSNQLHLDANYYMKCLVIFNY